jgi:hypothetical protein
MNRAHNGNVGADAARPVAPPKRLLVGDTVELREAAFDTVGTVVALVSPDHVRVEWNTGQGLVGKTTMLSVRAVRHRADD